MVSTEKKLCVISTEHHNAGFIKGKRMDKWMDGAYTRGEGHDSLTNMASHL